MKIANHISNSIPFRGVTTCDATGTETCTLKEFDANFECECFFGYAETNCDRKVDIYTLTNTHLQTHKHALKHTNSQKHIHPHTRHTHTNTHKQTHTYTHTYKLIYSNELITTKYKIDSFLSARSARRLELRSV